MNAEHFTFHHGTCISSKTAHRNDKAKYTIMQYPLTEPQLTDRSSLITSPVKTASVYNTANVHGAQSPTYQYLYNYYVTYL